MIFLILRLEHRAAQIPLTVFHDQLLRIAIIA